MLITASFEEATGNDDNDTILPYFLVNFANLTGSVDGSAN